MARRGNTFRRCGVALRPVSELRAIVDEPNSAPSGAERRDNAGGPLAEIARHPKGDALARLVHAAAFSAASERRPALDEGLDELSQRFGIAPGDGQTSFGDVLRALRRDHAATGPERALLGALLARGVALEPPSEGGEERVADALLWIAATTPVDPWPSLDAALGDRAAPLWRAVADALVKHDDGAARLSRAQSIVGALALATSTSTAADGQRARAATALRDPTLKRLLEGSAAAGRPAASSAVASGELVAAPRGPVALLLLTVTGILLLVVLFRLLGRFALRIRRPAELRVTSGGVTVVTRTEMLGRTLRERELHIPAGSLARAAREVRFPRLPLYAGVAALVIGSYLGLRLFIDGLRAGSPEFLALGAALVLLGLGVDYALSHVGLAAKGRCQVLFLPRRGGALVVSDVDPALADAALLRLRG